MKINSIKDLIDALEQLGEPKMDIPDSLEDILMLQNIN